MKLAPTTHRLVLSALLAGVALAPCAAWSAPALETLGALDFGTLAMRDNSTPSALRLSAAGAVTTSGEMIAIGGAQRGEYRLSGFPAGVILNFQFDDTQLSAGGFGLPEFFTATAFEHPETLVSSPTGEAEFSLGARLQNNTSGTPYSDAPYLGKAVIRIQYWSSEAGGYLTFEDEVDLAARVQSTLTVSETQEMSFGTVAAWSHPGGVARLILHPNGNLNSSGDVGPRLISLGGARAGHFLVSGAAPNYALSITPEAGSILMTHTTLGGASARFVVRDFTTQPAGNGTTNARGELTVQVGATLETEPGTQAYAPGLYRGSYTLTVSY